MPSHSEIFSSKIMKQSAMSITDQPNHEVSIVEVSSTQKSADPQRLSARVLQQRPR